MLLTKYNLFFKTIFMIMLCCLAMPINAETTMELEEAEITGARELPKVLYIVPWKKTRPDSSPLPMRSLINEALSPIDVDVFKRQVRYHEMIESTGEAPSK
jgi:hypothetical protein